MDVRGPSPIEDPSTTATLFTRGLPQLSHKHSRASWMAQLFECADQKVAYHVKTRIIAHWEDAANNE
jgi:hypothetical protein